MQVQRARPGDAAVLTRIAFAAKRHWGYSERWIQHWAKQLTLTPGLIAEQETYIAFVNDTPVGFYSLIPGIRVTILDHLWVSPTAMGCGVGRALFLHAVERVKASGCKALEIESDPNASEFYEHMGARRAATRVGELEGGCRELPVFIYEIAAVGRLP